MNWKQHWFKPLIAFDKPHVCVHAKQIGIGGLDTAQTTKKTPKKVEKVKFNKTYLTNRSKNGCCEPLLIANSIAKYQKI